MFLPSTFHIIESLIRLVDQTETGAAPFGLAEAHADHAWGQLPEMQTTHDYAIVYHITI